MTKPLSPAQPKKEELMATRNYSDYECPHCGQEQGDSWEYASETPEKRECDSCDKEFICWAEWTIEYLTEAITEEAPK